MNITEKTLKYLSLFTFLILVVSFLIFPLTDLDIWMHLVTGKYIVENFEIPKVDIYSYTAFGRPWIDHEWLCQIIFYSFYQWGGYNGLIILRMIIFLVIFSLFFIIVSKKTNYFLALLASFLVLLVSHERFFLRPEVFTLLFVLIYIFILEEYQVKPSKLIYLLPILQIFWVNLHGYFLLGIAIPFLFLIGQFLAKRNNLPSLLWLLLAVVLVSFINPYTYQGLIYPFKILASLGTASRSVLENIAELKSPFFTNAPTLFWFKFLIVVSIFSVLLSTGFKTLNLSRSLLYILFLVLGLSVKRHVALFAFSITLISVYNLREIKKFKDYFLAFKKFSFFPSLKILTLLLATVYFFIFTDQIASNRFYLKTRILKTFALGLTPELFPEKAVDFLLQHNFKGHILNDMIGGSYLVWRYYPQRKVFLDGRTEVYGPAIFKDYRAAFRQPELLKEIAQKYDIDYILINHSLGGRGKLIKYLLQDPTWALIYFDQIAAVFIKNTAENKNFIDKFLVDLNAYNDPNHTFWKSIAKDYQHRIWARQEAFPYGFLKAAYLFMDLEQLKLAQIAFNRALELNGKFTMAHVGLGNVYNQQKLYPQSLRSYANALSINPNLSESYGNMAIIFEKQKLISQAERYYKKSIQLNPYASLNYYNLGFLYFEQKRFDLAVKPFKKAVKLNPSFGEAYRALAASLANTGQSLLAKKNFQKAISLIPNDEELHYNLGMLLQNMGKFNASLSELQQVLVLNPNNLEARHNLALSYLSLGLVFKAQEQWLAIKKQEPDNRWTKEYLKKLQLMGYEYAAN